jgi:hypothetical protein
MGCCWIGRIASRTKTPRFSNVDVRAQDAHLEGSFFFFLPAGPLACSARLGCSKTNPSTGPPGRHMGCLWPNGDTALRQIGEDGSPSPTGRQV